MIGTLSLRFAGEPRHLTTARSFAGSIARVLGLDEGSRQDIRLAVSELVTVAITAGVSGLTVVAELDADTPMLRLETDATLPPIPAETSDLLGAMGRSVWSIDAPWVIRMGGAVDQ